MNSGAHLVSYRPLFLPAPTYLARTLSDVLATLKKPNGFADAFASR